MHRDSLCIGVLSFFALTVVVAQVSAPAASDANLTEISISRDEIVSRGIATIADLARELNVLESTMPGDGVQIRIQESSDVAEVSIAREEMASRGIVTVADLVRELNVLEATMPGDGLLIRVQDSNEVGDTTRVEVDGNPPAASDE